MTHSSWLLGLVSFSATVPILFFGIAGGLIADRFERRRVLLCTQGLAMMQAIILSYLTLTNQLQIWQVIALAFFLGTINSVDMPTRQAFVVDLVDKEDLVNAVGLSASLFHGSRVVGPALAGVLVGMVGEGWCFVINAFSFLAMLFALASIKLDRMHEGPHRQMHVDHILEAFRFASGSPVVRNVLGMTLTLFFFGMQYIVLLPVFVKDILHRQADTLGLLSMSTGVGALVASLLIARFGSRRILLRGVGFAVLFCALFMGLFSQAQNLPSALCCLLVMGLGTTLSMSGSNSLLQLSVSDSLRGRLMSIFTTVNMGLMSLGGLSAGFFAHNFGLRPTILVDALMCALAGLVYLAVVKDDDQSVDKKANIDERCYDELEVSEL